MNDTSTNLKSTHEFYSWFSLFKAGPTVDASPVPTTMAEAGLSQPPVSATDSGLVSSTPSSNEADHDPGRMPPAPPKRQKRRCCCCCCCPCSLRTAVKCILWTHFTLFFLASVVFLIVAAVLFHGIDNATLRQFITEEGDDPNDDFELLLNNTPLYWMYLAMYLTLYLVTCFGIKAVKKRRVVAYKVFVAIHCVSLVMESVATLIFESLVGASITFIFLRVVATAVLYRYIAVMAQERELIKQQEAREYELSSPV